MEYIDDLIISQLINRVQIKYILDVNNEYLTEIEKQSIQKLIEVSNKLQTIVINNYNDYIRYTVNRFNFKYDKDFIQECYLVIINCIKLYKSNYNNTFLTYLDKSLYRYKERYKIPQHEQPIESDFYYFDKGSTKIDNKDMIDFCLKNINNREKFIFIHYYYYEMTLEEIGEKLILTRERIRQILGSIKRKITHKLLKKNPSY